MIDYIAERIKRDARTKTMQQGAYLIVRGLLKRDNDPLFDTMDELFDIPHKEKTPQKTQKELEDEFDQYVKGA